MHVSRLQQIIASGIQVILTCDTGIAAFDAAAYAREHQVDMIITDHHELPPELPLAFSISNPRMLSDGHPLGTLPGVGVAYKLAEHLLALQGQADKANDLVDLAALGIVADVALLSGDTRYLLQRGLQLLRQTERTGLRALMDVAGVSPANLTAEHIGFILAPRLNALGRLGDANSIVELLTTTDESRARIMALELEGLNAQRQLLTNQVFQAALAQLEREPALLEQPAIVLANPTWPAGILGIVASRLVEHYHRPAILISTPLGEPGRGSARSIDGLNITQAIATQKEILLGFGGHAMAAGLSIEPGNIPAFRTALGREIDRTFGERRPERKLAIDGYLSLPELSLDLVGDLERLAPFGAGNPPFILASCDLTLRAQRTIGRTAEHLLLTVQDDAENLQEVVWWQGAGWPLPEGRFDLAYTLHASNYRGQPALQVQWIEARPSEMQPVAISSQPSHAVVRDYRQQPFPQAVLLQLRQEEDTITWCEADAVEKLKGQDRLNLTPARNLIIWTSPPSRDELREALQKVQPESILLFAIDPGMDQPETFLERLAGLAKFALNKRSGKANLSRLAAATAQRISAVLAGLDWLHAKGLLAYTLPCGNEIHLTASKIQDPEQLLLAETRLRAILKETAAFRAYFMRSDPEMLFGEENQP